MIKNITIPHEASILDALKLMDRINKKLLIIIRNNKFYGLLSVGDIQRSIIKNLPLETFISEIVRDDIRIANTDDTFDYIKNMMLNFRMEFCPVVNEKKEIVKVYYWDDLFQNKVIDPKKKFNIPVVIMAGGLGSRLKPITNVIPKPLIPIGENTIIENIFKRFSNHGCNNFYISVNYKFELIKYYLNQQKLPYLIDYFKEEKPMGTAGSLSLLKGKIKERFFVSNCDILVEQDYSEILDYHLKNKNEITIVAALKHYPIPYGIVETKKNGQLVKMTEKPDFSFKINSGLYILEPHLLNEIPLNKFFHITHLIEKIKNKGGKVGVFPVSEKSWKDIGTWEEYLKIIRA